MRVTSLGSGTSSIFAAVCVLCAFACSSKSASSPAAAPGADSDASSTEPPASTDDGGGDAGTDDAGPVDKAAKCTGTFGSALTNSFGRADGIVLAVVRPTDKQCPRPNGDHVVLELTMSGQAYRMVVNVQSDFGPDYRVRFGTMTAPLPAPAWAEGWHTGVALDYPTTLGIHTGDPRFAPFALAEVVPKVADAITIGDKISVYAWSSGGDSAHKVHRNPDPNADGAIVLGADGASPTWILFHFDQQNF